MGQYTEKINKIAEDFKIIEEYETCTSLLAQNGCLVITYKHGGYRITAGDKGGEYNGYELGPNEIKTIPATEDYYIKLKKQYGEKEGRTFSEQLGVWKKQLNNFIERKFK